MKGFCLRSATFAAELGLCYYGFSTFKTERHGMSHTNNYRRKKKRVAFLKREECRSEIAGCNRWSIGPDHRKHRIEILLCAVEHDRADEIL